MHICMYTFRSEHGPHRAARGLTSTFDFLPASPSTSTQSIIMAETQTFKFHNLRSFENAQGIQTAIKRPREITEFSFDDQHICHPLSNKSLRYFYPPQTLISGSSADNGIDLSGGFQKFEKYDESSKDLHLEPLLETLEAFESKKGKVEADIVTWRGMMTKVCIETSKWEVRTI